jgi:hypothetical protein
VRQIEVKPAANLIEPVARHTALAVVKAALILVITYLPWSAMARQVPAASWSCALNQNPI